MTSSTTSISCFYYSRVHLALPSFPTRRSSDLFLDELRRHAGPLGRRLPPRLALADHPSTSLVSQERYRRSEQHTSELQSLRHLVCRLLLEKKNEIGSIKDNMHAYAYVTKSTYS